MLAELVVSVVIEAGFGLQNSQSTDWLPSTWTFLRSGASAISPRLGLLYL